MNTRPDGFLGALLAAEGVGGMKTFINGPGGCRSRAQILLKELIRDYSGEEPGCCSSRYFSRQSKLPCTYLSSNDMVMGSFEKISEGIGSIVSLSDSDIVMIDTMVASLQVTDNEEAARRSGGHERTVVASRYLSSMSVYEGFDDTIVKIAEHVCTKDKRDDAPGTVNILGYNITDSGWEFGRKEISNILGSLGVETISFIGCACTKEEMERSPSAEMNIVIHPEFSIRTAEHYRREFGIPYLIPAMGSPVGYPSILSFIEEISEQFGNDPSRAIRDLRSEKANIDRIIMNADRIAGGLRGCGSSIKGVSSDILPIVRWMYEHLSIVPGHIEILEGNGSPLRKDLMTYLEEIGCSDAVDSDPAEDFDVMFTDGMTAVQVRERDTNVSCVETVFPYSYGTSFVNRSLIGTYGCRYILDEIFNGHGGFRCGQPTMADFR